MKIHTKVNVNLHPDKIRGDSQSVKTARNALGALYTASGKIHDLHDIVKGRALVHQKRMMAAMPKPADGKPKIAPPLMYDQQAASHVIDAGTPIAKAALNAADSAITALGEQVTRLDSAINVKVLAGKSARGAELRAWAAGQEHPFQKLGGLFQDASANAALVAAVLEAEPFLSNLTPENQNHLRKAASDVLAPDETQARKETSTALEQLTSASKSFTASAAEIFNGLRSPTAGAIDSIVNQGAE